MVQQLDIRLFHAINSWCGNWFLDSIVNVEERLFLINGGIILLAYWWLWFEGDEKLQARQRPLLVCVLLSSIVALFVARGLADALPFRLRPMYAGIPYNAPSMHIVSDYEKWSSFPSDHAAMYFALALGVFMLWRALGVLLLIYAAVWISLPRIYLGLHYPTDIAVGALIGLSVAWAASRIARGRFFERIVVGPLLKLEYNWAPLFYALAFGAALELAGLFADIRDVVRSSDFLFKLSFVKGMCLAVFCVVLAAMLVEVLRRRVQSVSRAARPIPFGNSRSPEPAAAGGLAGPLDWGRGALLHARPPSAPALASSLPEKPHGYIR